MSDLYSKQKTKEIKESELKTKLDAMEQRRKQCPDASLPTVAQLSAIAASLDSPSGGKVRLALQIWYEASRVLAEEYASRMESGKTEQESSSDQNPTSFAKPRSYPITVNDTMLRLRPRKRWKMDLLEIALRQFVAEQIGDARCQELYRHGVRRLEGSKTSKDFMPTGTELDELVTQERKRLLNTPESFRLFAGSFLPIFDSLRKEHKSRVCSAAGKMRAAKKK